MAVEDERVDLNENVADVGKSADKRLKTREYASLHEDPNGPYYLYHNENGTTGSITPILTGPNYLSWERKFWLQISFRGKTGFLDGTVKMPPKGTVEYDAWLRCNNLILSWMVHSSSVEIGNTILHCVTVKDAWDRLRVRYSKPDNVRVYKLQYDLGRLGQGVQAVEQYFTQISQIWEEINKCRPIPQCICGLCKCDISGKITQLMEIDRLFQFLMGLNDSFKALRGHVIAQVPLPDVDTAYGLVLQEEQSQQVRNIASDPVTETSAFAVQQGNPGTAIGKNGKPIPICTFCNKKGHTYEKCYKRIGYPADYNRGNKGQQQFYNQGGHPMKKPAYDTGRSFHGSSTGNSNQNRNYVANVMQPIHGGDKLDILKNKLNDLFTELESVRASTQAHTQHFAPSSSTSRFEPDEPTVAYSNLAGNFYQEGSWNGSRP